MGLCIYEVVLLKCKNIVITAVFMIMFFSIAWFAKVKFWSTQPISSDSTIRLPDGTELKLACDLPSTPSEIPNIKTTTRLDITAEKVTYIASEFFGLISPVVRSEYFDAFRVRDGDCDLWITDYGSIDYYVSGIDSPKSLPNNTEAKLIAENFLAEVKKQGITPRNPLVHIEFEDVIAGCESGTANSLTIQYWDVLFAVKFDCLKIAEAKISIGDNGSIVGVQGLWREVEQSGSVRILSSSEAIQKVSSTENVKQLTNVQKIQINSIALEYWDDRTALEQQDRLMPVYMLECVLTNYGGETSTAFLRVSASE